MIVAVSDLLFDDVAQVFEVDHVPSFGVGLSGDAHEQIVIVPVVVAVATLPENLLILLI